MALKRRHIRVSHLLMAFWVFIGVTLLSIFLIPTVRSETLLKLWALTGWQEDSVFRQILLSGGSATTDVLLKYNQQANQAVEKALLSLSPQAVDRLWDHIASSKSPGEIAYLASLIEHNSSPERDRSIRKNTSSENSTVKKTAIDLSIRALAEKNSAWLEDPDPVIRASVLSHFISQASLKVALEDHDLVVKEVLFLAIRAVDSLKSLNNELAQLKSLPNFNEDDPTASHLLANLSERIYEKEEQANLFRHSLNKKNEILMRSDNPEVLALTLQWIGLTEPENSVDLKSYLTHQEPSVRRQALMSLAKIGREDVSQDIWDLAQHDPEIIVQLTAWEALKILSPKSLLPEIRKFIDAAGENQKEDLMKALDVFIHLATSDDLERLNRFTEGYDYDLAQYAKRIIKKIKRGGV